MKVSPKKLLSLFEVICNGNTINLDIRKELYKELGSLGKSCY